MVELKHEFFKNGSVNQVRPDIVIHLKRKDVKQIAKWNDIERERALKFLERSKDYFENFINEIKKA